MRCWLDTASYGAGTCSPASASRGQRLRGAFIPLRGKPPRPEGSSQSAGSPGAQLPRSLHWSPMLGLAKLITEPRRWEMEHFLKPLFGNNFHIARKCVTTLASHRSRAGLMAVSEKRSFTLGQAYGRHCFGTSWMKRRLLSLHTPAKPSRSFPSTHKPSKQVQPFIPMHSASVSFSTCHRKLLLPKGVLTWI